MTTTHTGRDICTVWAGYACDECACLVANGDDSGMAPERADADTATIGAIVADEGGPVIVAEVGESELFRCVLCGDDVLCRTHSLAVTVAH